VEQIGPSRIVRAGTVYATCVLWHSCSARECGGVAL